MSTADSGAVARSTRPPARFTPPPELPPETLARSVAELTELEVPRGAYELGSQAWLARALVSTLADLGASDLRLLLGHGRGTVWVLPLALAWLAREPLVGGDYGPGELLGAVLRVDPDAWMAHPAWRERLRDIAEVARTQLHLVPAPSRAALADDLDAARDFLAV